MRLLRILRDRLILFSLIGILCVTAWAVGDIEADRPASADFPCLYTQFLVLFACLATLALCAAWQILDQK